MTIINKQQILDNTSINQIEIQSIKTGHSLGHITAEIKIKANTDKETLTATYKAESTTKNTVTSDINWEGSPMIASQLRNNIQLKPDNIIGHHLNTEMKYDPKLEATYTEYREELEKLEFVAQDEECSKCEDRFQYGDRIYLDVATIDWYCKTCFKNRRAMAKI